jgi:hypothetical protein
VTEADAVDASYRYPYVALRGPVFGLATQDPRRGPHWRLVRPATNGTPQQARDELNSLLWFRAKDDTDDRGVRRALLAAVAVLDREPVNEVEVLGVRYRVVRGDEFARTDKDGNLEPPRPTDVEPVEPVWDKDDRSPSPDVDFVLDPDREDGLMAGAMKLGLRDFTYAGTRCPPDMRKDSEQAVTACPDIVLLPVGFGIAERNGQGWLPRGCLASTPHAARQVLYAQLTETWPLIYEYGAEKRAVYARAAEEFRAAGRANEVRVADRLFRISRIERFVRCGPAGPERPRPSDQDGYGPMKIHPTMDEDGTLHYDH